MTVVTGEVHLDPAGSLPEGSLVHVVVEDTSRADAASVALARDTVALPAGASTVRFAIPVPEVDPRQRLTVRIHADGIGDGVVHPGDQVSVESTPVVTHGAPTDVVVQLHTVG